MRAPAIGVPSPLRTTPRIDEVVTPCAETGAGATTRNAANSALTPSSHFIADLPLRDRVTGLQVGNTPTAHTDRGQIYRPNQVRQAPGRTVTRRLLVVCFQHRHHLYMRRLRELVKPGHRDHPPAISHAADIA